MRTVFLLLFLVSLLISSCGQEAAPATANVGSDAAQLFYNGNIVTMEGDEVAYVEAVVEAGGKIAFVGTKADAEAAYPDARLRDLEGHTLLPGFIDPHSHIGMVTNTMGQADLSSEPVGDVEDFNDITEILVEFKEENNIPDGEWIFGWGYDENQLDEKAHITKRELDAVLPNNPVYLQHTSGHMGVANSAALDSAGIDASSKNPDGGIIARLPGTQEPSGLVQETAMYFFAGKAIMESAPKKAALFDKAQDYYAENGVTTAQEGLSDPSTVSFLQDKADSDEFIIDVVSLTGDIDLGNGEAADAPSPKYGKYRNGLKFEGVKIIADGSPQGKTAYFTEPYLTPVEACDSDCRGLPSIPQETLNEMFTRNYGNDRQLFIHANGDASIDMIIKAHEAAVEATGQAIDADRRTVVVHAQFARPDQLETIKKYNMMVSLFTNHAFFWGDVHVENLGRERAYFLSPMRAADSLGLVFTNHTDATVTPINQLFTVWTAVNRESRSGEVLGAEQRVSPYIALKAITINAAIQIFDEDLKGSLVKGKLADFVILDENPMKVAPGDIRDIDVLETIKEGDTVYKN